MEECWDHDSEARLTAVCVEERVQDMVALWVQDSKQKGTVNVLHLTMYSFWPFKWEEASAKSNPSLNVMQKVCDI